MKKKTNTTVTLEASMVLEKQIEDMWEQIGIEKIQDHMDETNWIWMFPKEGQSRVPRRKEIRETLEKLIGYIRDQVKENPECDLNTSTGGFHVLWFGLSQQLHVYFAIDSFHP